tara:strand:+ start:653 stop:1033 length:381 start_codon:yes stop_codon:yes gene_type:complete
MSIPRIYSLDTIHNAIGGDATVSIKTLRDIVRDLGFRKGRAKTMVFSKEQAMQIREIVLCQPSTSPTSATGTPTGLYEDGLTATNMRSLSKTQQTKRLLCEAGMRSSSERKRQERDKPKPYRSVMA